MIPKIIHYCWFSGEPFDAKTEKCIESWKKYLPDYEIRQCNTQNFDMNSNPFVAEAYKARKWAFVADYARLYLLYTYGGIYMDGDVEVLKSLDPLLHQSAFIGQERAGWISAGLIASEAGNDAIKVCLDYYKGKHFIKADGTYNMLPNVNIITHNLFEAYGFLMAGGHHNLGGLLHVYPVDFFSPKDSVTGVITITENTYAIHHFNGAWVDKKNGKREKWLARLSNIFGVGKAIFIINLFDMIGISKDKRRFFRKQVQEIRMYLGKKKIHNLRKKMLKNLY